MIDLPHGQDNIWWDELWLRGETDSREWGGDKGDNLEWILNREIELELCFHLYPNMYSRRSMVEWPRMLRWTLKFFILEFLVGLYSSLPTHTECLLIPLFRRRLAIF